jgi:hypothetical protein
VWLLLVDEVLLVSSYASLRVHFILQGSFGHEEILFSRSNRAGAIFKQVSVNSIFVLEVLLLALGVGFDLRVLANNGMFINEVLLLICVKRLVIIDGAELSLWFNDTLLNRLSNNFVVHLLKDCFLRIKIALFNVVH